MLGLNFHIWPICGKWAAETLLNGDERIIGNIDLHQDGISGSHC